MDEGVGLVSKIPTCLAKRESKLTEKLADINLSAGA